MCIAAVRCRGSLSSGSLRSTTATRPGAELSTRQLTGSLRDDLNAAFDQPLHSPGGFEGLERHIGYHVTNAIDSFDHVHQTR
jgi:hypothetical protein